MQLCGNSEGLCVVEPMSRFGESRCLRQAWHRATIHLTWHKVPEGGGLVGLLVLDG